MKDTFKDKTILITGGLGSIGSQIVDRLLPFNPKQIRVMDNRETELFYARQKYEKNPNMRFLLGDVREKERLDRAMSDADIVFHAAALKHVYLCEYDPMEAVKTNVLGTYNVIKSAMENNVEKVILISTDKAVNPTNVMGTTKLLAERLVSSMHFNKGKSRTKFGAVRFGNVLYSNGSVLEIWEKQLKEGKKITITDPEMTRFFMTIPQSVDLIFEATKLANSSEVFIFKMNSVRIKDLAEAFLEIKGKPSNHYGIIGRKLSEKGHEELFISDEKDYLLENDKMFVRLPLIMENNPIYDRYIELGFKPTQTINFSSSNKEILLDKEKIKSVLKEVI